MRCHYLSDLHLEAQQFGMVLPNGDVLIIAGDHCHARCLDPARSDRYSVEQRARVMRVIEEATKKFAQPRVASHAGFGVCPVCAQRFQILTESQ